MGRTSAFHVARSEYHSRIAKDVLWERLGFPSNADKGNNASKNLSAAIVRQLGIRLGKTSISGQRAGNNFEQATAAFIEATFQKLGHLRPGPWGTQKIGYDDDGAAAVATLKSGKNLRKLLRISQFEQYKHLVAIAKAASENEELAASLGSDYIIKPDVVIYRHLIPDEEINKHDVLIGEGVATRSSLRKATGGEPLLHASISCKLTIRSDRSQNSRSEALNLIRNRRGKLPHIVVVTAEPLPSRLASVALGNGDIDCVYHFALPELEQAVAELDNLGDSKESLRVMTQGKRLKDISDLPLDLAV